ncbi:protein kinase domain-containing protein [Brevundimonas sp. VNH65]|uniref:protein kinase domain-containing protein n=1 Tax=Brevundimonas sp. VNH65 TaxID=3400917 RepID=UPI003C04B50A
MQQNALMRSGRRRRWLFADAVFDEPSWSLSVRERRMDLEGKPLLVLLELLLHAGETVTRDELLDAVWPDVHVVEASLTTAISKLRKALGDRTGKVIETVPKIGYRLAAPVQVQDVGETPVVRFDFSPGDAVPGRPQWRLAAVLGDPEANDVWRAVHEKSDEVRIFKFADSGDRLAALRREVTLYRVLRRALGDAHPGVDLLEWNFDRRPYWIESRDGGLELEAAVTARDPDRRDAALGLELAEKLCRAVAAAHGAGVLHEDLKPSNILVATGTDGAPIVRLADFGNGRLLDAAVLARLNISGVLDDAEDGASGAGTRAYMAPELLRGEAPSVGSDVYALGLIILQLATRDFSRTFAPGWESGVEDELLRDDIAAASASDPALRLRDAAALADRLATLSERRAALAERRDALARLQRLEMRETARRAQRPAVIAAVSAAAVGLAIALGGGTIALQQRNEARQALALSEASYAFLADDVLGSPDPTRASQAEESLVEAIVRAGTAIDHRFDGQPLIAARLHASLARAFDQRSDYPRAFNFYNSADGQFRRAGQGDEPAAIINRLQWATAEALSTREGGVASARRRVAAEEARIEATEPDDELRFWRESARAHIALAESNGPEALARFGAARAWAENHPANFTPVQRLNIVQRHAFMLLRMGKAQEAEPVFRQLVSEMAGLQGKDHPDTLLLRLNLAQSLMLQHRHEAAVEAFDALLPMMELRLGRDHRHTLLLLAARQQSRGSLGLYAEAAADGDRVWRAAEAKDGAGSFAAVAGRTDTGINQCRAGATISGQALIRAAHSAVKVSGVGAPALENAVRAALADCLIIAGRHRDAEALLTDIDATAVGQLVGDANWGAGLDLMKAEIAWVEGRTAEARTLLARAGPGLADNRDRFTRQRQERLATALVG